MAAAARLHSHLPADIVLPLLRHAEPAIRADVCRLARGGPVVVATLIDPLADLHPNLALASDGRRASSTEAPLTDALPTHVIEAVPPIADEECILLLGRIACSASPELAAMARDALDATKHPLAARLRDRLS